MIERVDHESVPCPFQPCGAGAGQPCVFPSGDPWTVVEDGVERRVVHAGRYAETLPPADRAGFWNAAVERYLSEQLNSTEEAR